MPHFPAPITFSTPFLMLCYGSKSYLLEADLMSSYEVPLQKVDFDGDTVHLLSLDSLLVLIFMYLTFDNNR